MKKYEYKIIFYPQERFNKNSEGYVPESVLRDRLIDWNELGQDGWKFCQSMTNYSIFMREIEE